MVDVLQLFEEERLQRVETHGPGLLATGAAVGGVPLRLEEEDRPKAAAAP
jgi:hypothetical protein